MMDILNFQYIRRYRSFVKSDGQRHAELLHRVLEDYMDTISDMICKIYREFAAVDGSAVQIFRGF
jgi:hypothetical protein